MTQRCKNKMNTSTCALMRPILKHLYYRSTLFRAWSKFSRHFYKNSVDFVIWIGVFFCSICQLDQDATLLHHKKKVQSSSNSSTGRVKEQQHGQLSGAAAARAWSVEQRQHGQGQWSSSSTGRDHRRQGRSSRTGALVGEKEQHGCAGVGDRRGRAGDRGSRARAPGPPDHGGRLRRRQ
ncbi:uncharacterized protein LOC125521256 [Triticum urartu]|uniref:uncharacterized protein LOC125521256 n=1 Tax=Triticum urartu TaxID=4572 RepID=UPI002043193C|nr:uncharacterized protein LOC125521256 [Triticum urartu]XP_048542280.1 uncharacterized protein LOC125521256 [Triticum urartu]